MDDVYMSEVDWHTPTILTILTLGGMIFWLVFLGMTIKKK